MEAAGLASSSSLSPSVPDSSSPSPSPLRAVCPVLRAFAHSHAVDALIPPCLPPAPAALLNLRNPSGPMCLGALLWHDEGKETMYRWHCVGCSSGLPDAAGSTSSLESRNRGEKHHKCSGAREEPAVEVRAPSYSGMVWYCVREDQQCCRSVSMSVSSRMQEHSG